LDNDYVPNYATIFNGTKIFTPQPYRPRREHIGGACRASKLPYTRAMRIRRAIILLALFSLLSLAMQALTSSAFYKHLEHISGESHAH
jgi:hypothetical protein